MTNTVTTTDASEDGPLMQKRSRRDIPAPANLGSQPQEANRGSISFALILLVDLHAHEVFWGMNIKADVATLQILEVEAL